MEKGPSDNTFLIYDQMFVCFFPDVVYISSDVSIPSNAICVEPGATKQCKSVV